MKTKFFLALAYVSLLVSVLSVKAANNESKIQVSAESSEEVVPDLIKIRVNLSESYSKGKDSIKSLEATFNNVISSMDIDSKNDVYVVDQSSSYTKRKVSYNYKTYEIILHNAFDVDLFFTTLDENQLSGAYIVSMDYSKKEELQEKLRIDAIKKAQKVAQSLAGAISQTIGDAIDIDCNSYISNDVMVRGLYTKSAAVNMDSSSANEAEMKKITYKQRVSAVFRLNPKTDK